MAFGAYGGCKSDAAVLLVVVNLLAAAETAEDVLEVIDTQGPKIGYTPLSYAARLLHLGTEPEEAVQILLDGWKKEDSPFGSGKATTTVSAAGRKEVAAVVEPVAEQTPEEAYFASLLV